MYTVRITIQVRNSKRLIREFLRPEFALNTSSHATAFDSVEQAENAADIAAENFRGNGHTYIGMDIFKR